MHSAQASQNVRLMTILFPSWKWSPISQDVSGKYACGVPQLFVLMVPEPLFTSLGMLVAVRGQNLRAPFSNHSWKTTLLLTRS